MLCWVRGSMCCVYIAELSKLTDMHRIILHKLLYVSQTALAIVISLTVTVQTQLLLLRIQRLVSIDFTRKHIKYV